MLIVTRRYKPGTGSKTKREVLPMPNHVTPTELARLAGMERGEVLDACRKNSIPVLHGRIDKSLFMLSMMIGPREDAAQPSR